MSELKFTPGPWIYEYGRVVLAQSVIRDNYVILKADRSAQNEFSATERDANLKLAAKSPEMYELIKFISEILGDKKQHRELRTHEEIIYNKCQEILKEIQP